MANIEPVNHERGLPVQLPERDRWADNVANQTMADVAMDAADWYYPTSIDEESDIGGTTRANAPAGRGGTRREAPFASMGQAGDQDDTGPARTGY